MTDFDNVHKQWLKDVPYLWLAGDTLANSKRLYLVQPDTFAVFDELNRIASLRWVVETEQKDYFSLVPLGSAPERNLLLVLPAITKKDIAAVKQGEFRVNGVKTLNPVPALVSEMTVEREGAEPLELVPVEFGVPEFSPPFGVSCPIAKVGAANKLFVYENLHDAIKKEKISKQAIPDVHQRALSGAGGWKYLVAERAPHCKVLYEIVTRERPVYKLRQTLAREAQVVERAGPRKMRLQAPEKPVDVSRLKQKLGDTPVEFAKALEDIKELVYAQHNLLVEAKLARIEKALAEKPVSPRKSAEKKEEKGFLDTILEKIGLGGGAPERMVVTKGRRVLRRPVAGAKKPEPTIVVAEVPSELHIWLKVDVKPLKDMLKERSKLLYKQEQDMDALIDELRAIDEDTESGIERYHSLREDDLGALEAYADSGLAEKVKLEGARQTELQKKVGYKPQKEKADEREVALVAWKGRFAEIKKGINGALAGIEREEKKMDALVNGLPSLVKNGFVVKRVEKYTEQRKAGKRALKALKKSKLLKLVKKIEKGKSIEKQEEEEKSEGEEAEEEQEAEDKGEEAGEESEGEREAGEEEEEVERPQKTMAQILDEALSQMGVVAPEEPEKTGKDLLEERKKRFFSGAKKN